MECYRCGNKDENYFYKGSKGYYCRKCIRFSRILYNEEIEAFNYEINKGSEEYGFNYELTSEQIVASKKTCAYLKEGDVLLDCVCGAGKTEIVVEAMAYYLARGLKVCYAISRRAIVIDLGKRFKEIFKNAKVVEVYGGHHEELAGDLIVCTTHQLYRYHRSFDLLVLDEVDAYPLKNDETLMNIALRSSRGRIIFSTATVDENLLAILKTRKYQKVELNVRPNHKPLVVPKCLFIPKIIVLIYLFFKLKKLKRKALIFVSSKKIGLTLYQIFKHIYPCDYVYAGKDKIEEIIADFKNDKLRYLFTTTVLERGVTIKNIDVLILNFDQVFDYDNLIQMLGRVGRDLKYYEGDAYLLSNFWDKNVFRCLKYLKYVNGFL